MRKDIIGLYLLTGMAAAETTQIRLGHIVGFLFDVLGFNITDLTTAIPDYIFLVLLLIIAGMVVYIVKIKWKKL